MTPKLLPFVLLLAACDSQVDHGNRGQLLATLQGDMHTTTTRMVDAADVSIVWTVGDGGTAFVGADEVEVHGSLPSHFTLSVFDKPSPDVMSDWDGETFAAGLVVARPLAADPTDWQSWFGAENDRVVVYVPAAPVAGGAVAGLLHGTPAAGFHLYDVKRLTAAERQAKLDCITQASQGLGHMITRAEIFNDCGGDGNDELDESADDLSTQLSISIVQQFGLDQFNALPHWSGL